MLPRNPIAVFLCRLVLVYAILAAPWPGASKAYGLYVRALCRLVFTADDGQRLLSFEAGADQAGRLSDTRIVTVNKALLQPDGSGPVRNLEIAFGWQSVALVVALIAATPIPWSRRAWALLWGLLGIHAIMLSFIALCIWNESAEILLVSSAPFWKALASGCQEALASQINLTGPVLTWLLVTFRREDLRTTLGQFVLRPAAARREVAV